MFREAAKTVPMIKSKVPLNGLSGDAWVYSVGFFSECIATISNFHFPDRRHRPDKSDLEHTLYMCQRLVGNSRVSKAKLVEQLRKKQRRTKSRLDDGLVNLDPKMEAKVKMFLLSAEYSAATAAIAYESGLHASRSPETAFKEASENSVLAVAYQVEVLSTSGIGAEVWATKFSKAAESLRDDNAGRLGFPPKTQAMHKFDRIGTELSKSFRSKIERLQLQDAIITLNEGTQETFLALNHGPNAVSASSIANRSTISAPELSAAAQLTKLTASNKTMATTSPKLISELSTFPSQVHFYAADFVLFRICCYFFVVCILSNSFTVAALTTLFLLLTENISIFGSAKSGTSSSLHRKKDRRNGLFHYHP